ncbi:MAG TPA: glycosyltransferase [Vicinamibacterales bacterium]|nr:glycosyltransferase [Vicinamibacterales bacterium]
MRVLVLVNEEFDKLHGVRARELFLDFADDHDVAYVYRRDVRKLSALGRFCWHALRDARDVVYVEKFGYAGIVAALTAKALRGSKMVVSNGDAVSAFARSRFSRPKALAARALEWAAQTSADRLIVWGPYHRELLERRGCTGVEWIPGGVDTSRFRPLDAATLRRRLGVEGRLTVGVIGSINWNRRTEFCYGRDVLEVVRLLKDSPVAGIIVGTGNGLAVLRDLAREYGIGDRVVMTGWVAHEELPEYVNAIDVCLSTQSNDLVGAVRITAKIPEYLACGRYIIASDVGGARDFVRGSGTLIPIGAVADENYLRRVAEHVQTILDRPELLDKGRRGIDVAKREFDYAVLRPRLSALLNSLWPETRA